MPEPPPVTTASFLANESMGASLVAPHLIATVSPVGVSVAVGVTTGPFGKIIGGSEMARRVNSELLLVGSLPADSTETALREAAGLFGDLVFALPDGETGPRAAWVGYERERLVRPNADVEVVSETESPTGIPRHAYETPVFKIRAGADELHFDSWPRIDDAIASWRSFSEL